MRNSKLEYLFTYNTSWNLTFGLIFNFINLLPIFKTTTIKIHIRNLQCEIRNMHTCLPIIAVRSLLLRSF